MPFKIGGGAGSSGLADSQTPIVDVRDFGYPSSTASDASAAVQAAHDSLGAWGGVIQMPAGPVRFDNSVNVTKAVRFSGAGWYETFIRKGADVPLFSVIGAINSLRQDFVIDNLQLNGNNNVAWTQPLLDLHHASRMRIENVLFLDNWGMGLQARNAWDAWIYNSYFANTGGTDGTKPAVWCAPSPDGAFSYAGNTTNNLWFVNCRVEPMRDGGLWFDRSILNRIVNLKMEDHVSIRDNLIRMDDCRGMHFTNSQLTLSGPLAAGVSTGRDFVRIARSENVAFTDTTISVGSFTAGQIRSIFRLDGNTTPNRHISFKHVHLGAGSGSAPDSVFSWTGTNNYISRESVQWNDNWWSAAMDSGSPSSYANSPSLPSVAGVVADASFNTPPANGQAAINSVSNVLALRSGGAWVPYGSSGVSADRTAALNSADVTLVATDSFEQRVDGTLTRNAAFVLPASGHRFRFVKTGIGNFTLAIGSLFTFPPVTRGVVEAAYNGTAWILSRQEFWGMDAREAYTKPNDAIAQTISREDASASAVSLTSGTQQFQAIWLPKGIAINGIKVLSGTTAYTLGTDAHKWASIYTLPTANQATGAVVGTTLTKAAVTANDTNAAWAANTIKQFTFSTPYVTPYEGYYYVGLMVNFGTGGVMGSLVLQLNSSATAGSAQVGSPGLTFNSTPGSLTDPASAPTNPSALAVTGTRAWLYAI